MANPYNDSLLALRSRSHMLVSFFFFFQLDITPAIDSPGNRPDQLCVEIEDRQTFDKFNISPSHPVTSLDATNVKGLREFKGIDVLPDIDGLFAVSLLCNRFADKRIRALELKSDFGLAQTVCHEPGISDVDPLLQAPITLWLSLSAFFFFRCVKVLYFHANIIAQIRSNFNKYFNFFGIFGFFSGAAL